MALSVTPRTGGSSTAASTTYATASITPTAGKLLVAWFAVSGIATDVASTASGLSGTWVNRGDYYPPSGLTTRQLTLFTCSDYSGTGAVTFANTDSGTSATWSVFEVDGADLANPIVAGSFVTNSSGASNVDTLSVTLNSPASSDNRPIAMYIGDNNTANLISPRTNWTEIHDVAIATPSLAMGTQWRSDAFETTASGSWDDAVTYFTVILAAELAAASARNSDPDFFACF